MMRGCSHMVSSVSSVKQGDKSFAAIRAEMMRQANEKKGRLFGETNC